MQDGFTIQMDGFDQLLATLKKAPQVVQEDAIVDLESAAKTIQGEAKLAAPVNFGTLRNMIVVDPPRNGGLTQSVSSLNAISAYVEFGTGTKVSIAEDPQIREYEATFKTGKNVPGMYAHPFFFPAILAEIPLLLTRLKNTLQKAISKT